MNFKEEYSFNQRKIQSESVLDKFYPQKVPVIIQKHKKDKNLQSNDKRKYLIPHDMKYSSLMITLRHRVFENMPSSVALFLSTENGTMLCHTDNILNIYDKYVDKDGFLYLYYCSENTFGH